MKNVNLFAKTSWILVVSCFLLHDMGNGQETIAEACIIIPPAFMPTGI